MASRWLSNGPISIRHRVGWVFVGFTLLVTGPVFAAAFVPVRPTTAAIAVTAIVLTVISYIYFVAPRIVVAEEAIRVENSWREHTVPWGALIDVDTRFQLTLLTAQGAVHVQAAPSPGGFSAMRAKADEDFATSRVSRQRGGALRPGDLPNSPSGALASVIRGHWQDLVESGAIDTAQVSATRLRVAHLVLTLGGVALAVILWVLA
ncbi:MAG TPA: PH domain-containing protein [Intrasporangiaceae bacterium]|nr:PH domain-containing protein [Intrasporangiaceae bacterium]